MLDLCRNFQPRTSNKLNEAKGKGQGLAKANGGVDLEQIPSRSEQEGGNQVR